MVQVTLRRLGEGSEHQGILRKRHSNRLDIELQGGAPDLPIQSQLEVSAPGTLLLGTLLGRSGDVLFVLLEHEVDLGWLERVLDMWQRTEAT